VLSSSTSLFLRSQATVTSITAMTSAHPTLPPLSSIEMHHSDQGEHPLSMNEYGDSGQLSSFNNLASPTSTNASPLIFRCSSHAEDNILRPRNKLVTSLKVRLLPVRETSLRLHFNSIVQLGEAHLLGHLYQGRDVLRQCEDLDERTCVPTKPTPS